MSYTKLHQELVQSSVWSEPDHVRIMWVTLLSQADQHGYVYGSPVGLARLAALDVPRAIEALERLGQPDPYSQNKAEDGRRIVVEEIEGRACYRIVTHAFYRALKSDEERKRTNSEKQARYRKRKASAVTSTVTECRPSVTPLSVSGSDLKEGRKKGSKPRPHSMPDDWAPSHETLSRISADKIPEGFTREVREWFTSKHLDEPKITKPDWDGSFSRTVKRHWASEWGDRWRGGQRKTPKSEAVSMGFID